MTPKFLYPYTHNSTFNMMSDQQADMLKVTKLFLKFPKLP